MKKNTNKIKSSKAAKVGNPASKAITRKNAAKPVVTDAIAVASEPVEPPAPEPTTKDKPEARDGSKKAVVLALLRREGGATLGDIAQATDWQLHSIRGFLSGQIAKKMGLKIESTKDDGGKRRYHVAG